MICTHVAVLQPSVALQVRVMIVPWGHWPFTASLCVTDGIAPQLSVAVAVPVTEGSVGVPQGSVMSGGQVIVGRRHVVDRDGLGAEARVAARILELVGAGDHVVARAGRRHRRRPRA